MATEIPEWLPGYFATRDAEREQAAWATFATLTEREQQLVKEAAVMGYVLASLGHRDEIPRDRAIVQQVINGCQSHSDRFPLLGAPVSGTAEGRTER